MFRRLFRFSVIFPALLATGCGGPGKPVAQSTIASTGITVTLLAPDEKHHFRYTVSDSAGTRLERFLGPARISYPVRVQVSDDGADRVRITWGSGSETAWTLIDALNRKVISDSNEANQ